MKQYDVVIIGAGLGGLLCAAILAKEGLSVAIVEQNKQIGGCLQTFSFDKKIFDSCIHYIGALEEGQTQKRIFDYLDISIADLKLKKYNTDCVDKIIFGDDNTEYAHAQGDDNFVEQLSAYFPKEKKQLQQYIATLQYVSSCFPLYQLKNGTQSDKDKVIRWNIPDTFASLNCSPLLQNVLTGHNILYSGIKQSTPFYVHTLVTKSYIESAYKCSGNSSQIAKQILKKIRTFGGEVIKNEKVIQLVEEQGKISYLQTESGLCMRAKNFIANIHPAQVLDILQSNIIRKSYTSRVQALTNTASAFMINIIFQPRTVPYIQHNVYWNRDKDPFAAIHTMSNKQIDNYVLYFSEDEKNKGYTDTLSILTYMNMEQLNNEWHKTINTSNHANHRGKQYDDFKNDFASKLIDQVAIRYPLIKQHIQSYKTATPLTFRDYMGTADGSMYGIAKDAHFPESTRIHTKTKIPNLFLTGQNINLHGVLGVSITAVATCGDIIGLDYLLGKIPR